jgi:hypothetical protein
MMFHNQYVARVVRDFDYVEPSYFRFGSALHSLAEKCSHDASELTQESFEGACMEYRLDVDKDGPKLVSMLREYSKARNKGERILAMEMEVVTGDFVMYLDAVIEDERGWFIVDLKTASELDPLVKNKMRNDYQVNLYMTHAGLVAEKLGLDMAKFVGFEYREIMKPKERMKKNETREELAERMCPAVRFTLLRPSDARMDETMEQVYRRLVRARELFSGCGAPTENRSLCVNKGTSCRFFSQCNGGKTYTQMRIEEG